MAVIFRIKYLFGILILAFFVACGQSETKEKIEGRFENGSPKQVAVYKDGKKIQAKKFYQNGAVELEGSYDDDGKKHGYWKYLYPDGKLWSEGEYLHGKRHGMSKVYYENGVLRYEGNYENNEKIGLWIFYDEGGFVLEKKEF